MKGINRITLKCLLALLLLLNFCSALYSQEYTLVDDKVNVFNGFVKKGNGVKSVQSNFIQKKNISSLGIEVVSKGKFFWNNSNKMRWEYTQPTNFVFVYANGNHSITNNGEIVNVPGNQKDFFRVINKIITSALQGKFENDNMFAKELFENSSYYKLSLVPELNSSVREFISNIDLLIKKEKLQLESIVLTESNGDVTTIIISDLIYNQPIKPSLFIVN